jgi:heptose-I-phosphate ethanolaminephosphotransferase
MDTHVTKIGTGAYKSIFLNTKHTSDRTILDIELVNALKDIVQEEGNKKVVFLHMLGTHLNYKMRYPKEFEVFKNTPITKYKKKKAFETINAYDNAIRYNDYILRNIIEVVRKENLNGFVSYFSDHGQEVFGDMDFFGHTIDEEISKNMYEIPMFLWTTEEYNLNNSFEFDLNRKYMIDDLIHSIADISNIKSDQIDSTRSIFSKSFKERKRIIKDTIDFDSYYK